MTKDQVIVRLTTENMFVAECLKLVRRTCGFSNGFGESLCSQIEKWENTKGEKYPQPLSDRQFAAARSMLINTYAAFIANTFKNPIQPQKPQYQPQKPQYVPTKVPLAAQVTKELTPISEDIGW